MGRARGTYEERLRQRVRLLGVYWELHALEDKPLGGDRLKVGYELFLAGSVPGPAESPGPMHSRVAAVVTELRTLVQDLVAHSGDQSEHAITVFDACMQAAADRQLRDEAGLRVAITHRERLHLPFDETLAVCVRRMEARLAELGAQKALPYVR